VLERLVASRRAHLTDLVAEWEASERPDPGLYLRKAVADLIADVRQPT
jgi:hypothetical protein